MRLDGIVGKRLMRIDEPPSVIDRNNNANVRGFAQTDAVWAFMEGVYEEYQSVVEPHVRM